MTTLIFNLKILALRKHPNLCKPNIKVRWQMSVTISSPFQDGAAFKKVKYSKDVSDDIVNTLEFADFCLEFADKFLLVKSSIS